MLGEEQRSLRPDAGMQQGFELSAHFRMGKNALPQGCAVKRAVLQERVLAEEGCDFLQGGLAGGRQCVGDDVRVDHGDAQFGKYACGFALAAADAAGQANDHDLVARQVKSGQLRTPEQCRNATERQIRAEGDRHVAAVACDHDQADADDGTDQRRKQDDGRQHLPAEPCAYRRQQFEVAIPHALLAGGQLEQPVDRPQRQISGGRADDGRVQIGKCAAGVDDQPGPEQGQGDVIRQQKGIEVDKGQRDQGKGEQQRRDGHAAKTELPGHKSAQRAGQRLDQRIAGADGGLAVCALAAKCQIADDRDVFHGRDLMAAVRAGGAWYHQIVFGGRQDFFTPGFGDLAVPLGLHHFRQAMDHDVQETAYQQSEQRDRRDKKPGLVVHEFKQGGHRGL